MPSPQHSGQTILTEQEVRQPFSQSQQDTEIDFEETEELTFVEFIESLARLALQKWETKVMRPPAKIRLALEAIIDHRGGAFHPAR